MPLEGKKLAEVEGALLRLSSGEDRYLNRWRFGPVAGSQCFLHRLGMDVYCNVDALDGGPADNLADARDGDGNNGRRVESEHRRVPVAALVGRFRLLTQSIRMVSVLHSSRQCGSR